MKLTVIIITYNEEIHIKRCIDSVKRIASNVIVVDSFSSDNTTMIAEALGAIIYQNRFIHHAQQFQWALDNCEIETEWAMKLDADEIITEELCEELLEVLPNTPDSIKGYRVKRRLHFMGKWIKRGYYPIVINRIFKLKYANMEQKWMDEQLRLTEGSWGLLEEDIIDDNLNNLTWWTNKHNNYSTREAIMRLGYQSENTHKANKKFFLKLPPILRGFFYFMYRYLFKMGFLDGKEGFLWHFLQGFWYQVLIDAKILQIKQIATREKKSISETIEEYFIKA